jgi:hypothetical protein
MIMMELVALTMVGTLLQSSYGVWKPDVTAGDLKIACVFNALFLTLAVADLYADIWTEAWAVTESDLTPVTAFIYTYETR